MLDHLDDTTPYVPDERLRAGVSRRARTLRRRRRVGLVTIATALVVPGLAGLWLRSVQPHRVDVITPLTEPTTSPVSLATSTATNPAQTSATTADPPLVDAVDILVVGVDTRADDPAVTGSRGDTIMVVRIDPAAGVRRILSVPRDLYVTDPTTGAKTRINGLVGDRRALVQTVEQLTHVHVDHYVELDFITFAMLGDAVGGVDVGFAQPVRDLHTGFEARIGCTHLDGTALLRYARSRYLERFDGERWVGDPSSDLGRMARQGDLARRVVASALDGGRVDLTDVISRVLPRLTVDEGFTIGEARRIAGAARTLAGVPVAWSSLPATVAMATLDGGEESVLIASGDVDLARASPTATATNASTDTTALGTSSAILPIDQPGCGS